MRLILNWTNKNLFYNAYKRTNSFFENSELASSGVPSGEELDLLNDYREIVAAKIIPRGI